MTHVTFHVTTVTTKMADDKDADAFMLLYFLIAPLVTRQISNLLVVHFIRRLSLETKTRPKFGLLYRSSDVRLHC